jgi:hypothetical protein
MRQQDVIFAGAGGVRLAGTLTVPDDRPGSRPLAAILLLAGSGPTDRDGNQLPTIRTDILKQIAEALAAQGFASLRFDKRGVGGSLPLPVGVPIEDLASWDSFVGDAKQAYGYLCAQPNIDPRRTGILGHSEGGLIALDAAMALNPVPQVLVLVSTPGRRVDVVVNEQLVRLLKVQQATADQTRYYLDKNDAIVATIRQTGKVPDDVPAGLAALYPPYLGKYYRSLLALDPADRAMRYPGPVLILQGERDVQVSPTADAPALDAALRRRRPDDHALVIVRGASHNMKVLGSSADPGLTGPIAPQAASALCSWLTTKMAV